MSGNGLESRVRVLCTVAAAVAAVVLFLWASQAGQDEAIRRNEKHIAVLGVRLDGIRDDVADIKTTVERIDGKLPVARPVGDDGELAAKE